MCNVLACPECGSTDVGVYVKAWYYPNESDTWELPWEPELHFGHRHNASCFKCGWNGQEFELVEKEGEY